MEAWGSHQQCALHPRPTSARSQQSSPPLEFAPYTEADCPLEPDSLLVKWIEQSVQQVVESTPSLAAVLPTDPSTFFHHIATTRTYPSISSPLQRQLSAQAAQHSHEAFLTRCQEMKKADGGAMLAHAKAVSAPRAWAWKNVVPMTQDTDMCDEHYRVRSSHEPAAASD